MRFKRSQLLRNVTNKQLLEYQNEQGFFLMDYSHEEISISEMISTLYSYLRYSGSMMISKRLEPVDYLNMVDFRNRIALDISRCLVTAKKLGENLDKCPSADLIFNYMIRNLSQEARCLGSRAMEVNFGRAYNEAAYTMYSEVCTLIRRLKVTRQGYDAIKERPGAVLCESSKQCVSEKNAVAPDMNNAANKEQSVRAERAISALPTVVLPEGEALNDETGENGTAEQSESGTASQNTAVSETEATEVNRSAQRSRPTAAERDPEPETESGDAEIEPDERFNADDEIEAERKWREDDPEGLHRDFQRLLEMAERKMTVMT